jgi:hypothetical protein
MLIQMLQNLGIFPNLIIYTQAFSQKNSPVEYGNSAPF